MDEGIAAAGLCRRFGRRWALAGVDLVVPRGSSVMITGRNGSGKTTMLRCFATALPPHMGGVRLLGQDPWLDIDNARRKVVLLSHATRMYEDLTASDNLLVWARLGGMDVDVVAALRDVGLEAARTEPVRSYSAGMRRRVALAIALLKKPDVMLLDEPFAALDPGGRAMMGRVISTLRARGATLAIATHLPQVAGQYCDMAAHLADGKIAWTGAPADAPAEAEEVW